MHSSREHRRAQAKAMTLRSVDSEQAWNMDDWRRSFIASSCEGLSESIFPASSGRAPASTSNAGFLEGTSFIYKGVSLDVKLHMEFYLSTRYFLQVFSTELMY